MPTVNNDAFHAGIAKGLERFQSEYNENLVFDLDSELRIRQVLDNWDEDLNDRFVTLFAELSTLAGIVRVLNQEPSLTHDELVAYLAHSISFFNSFTHL